MNTKQHHTHIAKIRQKFHSEKELLKAEMGINDEKYTDMILDHGKYFLNNIYPSDNSQYKEYYELFYTSRVFWNWYFLEFKKTASAYITRTREVAREINYTDLSVTVQMYNQSLSFRCLFEKDCMNALIKTI